MQASMVSGSLAVPALPACLQQLASKQGNGLSLDLQACRQCRQASSHSQRHMSGSVYSQRVGRALPATEAGGHTAVQGLEAKVESAQQLQSLQQECKRQMEAHLATQSAYLDATNADKQSLLSRVSEVEGQLAAAGAANTLALSQVAELRSQAAAAKVQAEDARRVCADPVSLVVTVAEESAADKKLMEVLGCCL